MLEKKKERNTFVKIVKLLFIYLFFFVYAAVVDAVVMNIIAMEKTVCTHEEPILKVRERKKKELLV